VTPPFPVYIFDVDGTLLDSAADICGAIQEALSSTGHAAVPDSFLRRYIGRHLTDLFQDLGFQDGDIERLIQDYREIYRGRGHRLTRVYPGVAEALASLRGRKTTATTKQTATTRVVLERFGLLHHFDHVQGTDGFPSKPAPDVVLKSLEALGARPQECLLVGDSAADMEAGRHAGVRTCAVRYGYGNEAEMARFAPDYWIADPRELL
jgi:HAD superfamily hydrolase (TIGR01509 family)